MQDCNHLLKIFYPCIKWSPRICINICAIVINQTAFPFPHTMMLIHWLRGIRAVVLNHVRIPFEYSLGRWAAIMLNTCSCVPLQKQTTTIILISALFRPLQQSSRLSSEDTWVSLIHHRDYLKHIVTIVPCFDLANDNNANILLSNATWLEYH